MDISQNTIELIKHYESLHDGDLTKVGLQPKADPIGIYTEGYGRAMIDPLTRKWVKEKKRAYELQTIFTTQDAEVALLLDLKPFQLQLDRAAVDNRATLNEGQYGALISIGYNCGATAMIKTLQRCIATNATNKSREEAFGLYSKARLNGVLQPLRGLVRRRYSEAYLFNTGQLMFPN